MNSSGANIKFSLGNENLGYNKIDKIISALDIAESQSREMWLLSYAKQLL